MPRPHSLCSPPDDNDDDEDDDDNDDDCDDGDDDEDDNLIWVNSCKRVQPFLLHQSDQPNLDNLISLSSSS